MNKNIVAMLCLLWFALTGCATAKMAKQDQWFGKDKLYHFAASAAIGAGATKIAERNGVHECSAPVVGISVVFAVGVGKEFYDLHHKRTFFSWKDMAWNAFGGTVGSIAASDCF